MNTQEMPPQKPFKDALFARIEAEQVHPRSRLFFQTREYTVWLLWLFSIMVGALAVAVSMFVMVHRQYELYEATHENLFTFMVEVLPYIWIITFALMVYVAVYNLRHTKHGYRYPVWFILASSIVLSFAGGSTLQYLGLGYSIDHILGTSMGMYMSQEKLERRLWQSPDNGRLLGVQIFSDDEQTSTILFEDITGEQWKMNISELQPRDLELLASNKTVRLLGKCTDKEAHSFHACGVFPWMLEKEATMDEMMAERKAFLGRLNKYIQPRRNDAAKNIAAADSESSTESSEPNCAGVVSFRY